MKICRNCGVEFNTKYCKPCDNKRSAERRRKFPQEGAKNSAEWAMKNKEKKAADAAKWYKKNKEVTCQRAVEWKKKNTIKVKTSGANRYKKNRLTISIKTAAYRLANRDKINARHSAYKKENPSIVARANHQRRFKKNGNGGILSKEIIERLIILQKGRCACCGVLLRGIFHVDHILPLKLGGTNTDNNVQLLTPICNLKKSAKHPIDYMQSRGLLC